MKGYEKRCGRRPIYMLVRRLDRGSGRAQLDHQIALFSCWTDG